MIHSNNVDYESVLITETPEGIIAKEIEPKQCTNNAQKIVSANEGVEYIEGILLAKAQGFLIPIAHAWNKKGDEHFDVTYASVKADVVEERFYFPYHSVDIKDLKTSSKGVVEFTKHSEPFLIEIRNRFK